MGSTGNVETKSADPCLVLEDLSIDFGGLRAVDGVNLTIVQGERRVLMGPNGAGKTTLFNLISGIYPPSRGRIFYFGKEISRYPIYRRAALGMARTYQVTNLFRCLTVAENILMACQALDRRKFVMFRTLSSLSLLHGSLRRCFAGVRFRGEARRTGEESFPWRSAADRGSHGPRRKAPPSASR
ncbi:MAG: hypothetical protein CO013_09365 [Syntrophobacterales bacterium CG_4_8_14_3_um_filter_58_8]|nr:MAG: hypothetical protein CO013_09365 [Syntrophobacterales bacterium CG_4_8_14_3_um_filter_58_8]